MTYFSYAKSIVHAVGEVHFGCYYNFFGTTQDSAGEEITNSQHIWCRICEVVVEGAGMKDEHLYLQLPWQFSGLAQLPSQSCDP
jgi:hypothetical protein